MRNLEHLATIDHTYGIGRCGTVAGGHGVAWKHKSGANLKTVKCPIHDRALSQTTRLWKQGQIGGWDIVPAATIEAIAQQHYKAGKAVTDAQVADGNLTKLRDLQPGQLFNTKNRYRSGVVIGGKLVEVEKLAGGTVRVTVSRTYDEVAGGVAWYLRTSEGTEEYAREAESLTRSFVAPGSTLVITGQALLDSWQGKQWTEGSQAAANREARPFAGWAVEQPQCIVELWQRRIARLRAQLQNPVYSGAVLPTRSKYETEERHAERVAEARERGRVRRAALETELRLAEDRLQLHTGSLHVPADLLDDAEKKFGRD